MVVRSQTPDMRVDVESQSHMPTFSVSALATLMSLVEMCKIVQMVLLNSITPSIAAGGKVFGREFLSTSESWRTLPTI
jgi:hypothetical protein